MMNDRRPPRYEIWLFIGPAINHFVWALAVLFSDVPLVTTGLADINVLFENNNTVTGSVLLVFALAALVSVALHNSHRKLAFVLLLGQQVMMIMSLLTAWECIKAGRFANGVEVGWLFLLCDQVHQGVIPFCHSCLIVHVFIWPAFIEWRTNRRLNSHGR